MTDALLSQILSGMRMVVLVGWTIIVIWGWGRAWRALTGRARRGDWVACAVVLLGVTLVLAMALYLGRWMTPAWMVAILFQITIAAGVIIVSHSKETPEGHKRAVAVSHAAIILLSFCAGAMT